MTMMPMMWLAASLALGASAEGTMTFEIDRLRSDRGQVGCALFKGSEGFPMESDKAFRRQYAPISDGRARCVFERLPPGDYALSVMHDEDGDGEIDRGLFGPPTEGWATSNNAAPRAFGPPSWDRARFRFDGRELSQTLKIRY